MQARHTHGSPFPYPSHIVLMVCDDKSDKTPDQTAWEQALVIAQGVHAGNLDDFVEGATHYHATYVLPDGQKARRLSFR